METKLTIASMTADSVSMRKRPVDMEAAGIDPGGDRHDAGGEIAVDKLEARHRAADRGDDHAEDGRALRGPVADQAGPKQAGESWRRRAGRRTAMT